MEKEDAPVEGKTPDASLDKSSSIIDLLGQNANAADIPFEPVTAQIRLRKADLD